MASNPTSVHDQPPLESRFAEIVSRLDPAYQEVIALGWQAVPLILAEWQLHPIDWAAAALKIITGANPALIDNRDGSTTEADRQAWLAWGRQECWLPDHEAEAIDEAEEARLRAEVQRLMPTREVLELLVAQQKANPSKINYDDEDDELPC